MIEYYVRLRRILITTASSNTHFLSKGASISLGVRYFTDTGMRIAGDVIPKPVFFDAIYFPWCHSRGIQKLISCFCEKRKEDSNTIGAWTPRILGSGVFCIPVIPPLFLFFPICLPVFFCLCLLFLRISYILLSSDFPKYYKRTMLPNFIS